MEYLCTYLCPLRMGEIKPALIRQLHTYFKFLSELGCEVLIVDGSPAEVFDIHHRVWKKHHHIPVDPEYTFLNGKVNGIWTGVPEASHGKIILGDDDIRYSEEDIFRMVSELDDYDVVRPQNYFYPSPIWSDIDSGRILLNRAFFERGDFPGTFGFRKTTFLAAGSFDGDVLFDNEELIRHFENFGARIHFAKNFMVLRTPPKLQKWMEQRPRQAYEDFIMRNRTIFFLSVLPSIGILRLFGKKKAAGALAATIGAGAVAMAYKGRNKKVRKYFPVRTTFLAPLWVLERSISIYLALYYKISRGGYAFGDKVISKGTGEAWKKLPETKQNKTKKIAV